MVPAGADDSSEAERERTRPARLDVTADFGAEEDEVASFGSTLGPAGEKQPATVVTASDTAGPRRCWWRSSRTRWTMRTAPALSIAT